MDDKIFLSCGPRDRRITYATKLLFMRLAEFCSEFMALPVLSLECEKFHTGDACYAALMKRMKRDSITPDLDEKLQPRYQDTCRTKS
jgi:hypothetical protein